MDRRRGVKIKSVHLLHSSLQCVWWTIPRGGVVKVHAIDSRWPDATMCGRAIPQDAIPIVKREVASDRLCGSCLKSLRTYTRDYVRFEIESPGEA